MNFPRPGWSAVAALAIFVATGCTGKNRNEPANTVHFEAQGKFKTLDPAHAEDEYSRNEVYRTYEGLLTYHPFKRPYVLIPNLAEALPEVSADGKTYTIKLKKGVLFVDDAAFKESNGKGRELVADDVVYSFKRLANPKENATSFWVLDDRIVGLNEWRAEMSKAATVDFSKPVEGLVAVDRYTVRIKLKKPNGLFASYLAMPETYIVPHEAVEHYGPEFANHGVGTGPFKLVEFNPNQRAVWDRNPTYRKELYPSDGNPGDKESGLLADAGKPIPFVDRVVTTVFEETQPMWLNFMSGKLEAAWIPKDNYGQAIAADGGLTDELKAKGVKLERYPRLDLVYFNFNLKDPVLGKNKLLRQAISMAFDSDKAIELFYNGRAIPAQSVLPPDMQAYDPEFKNPFRQYNVAKAKELLKQAGFPDGKGAPEIEILTLADSTARQWSEWETASLASIGLKAKIVASSWPEMLKSIKEAKGHLYTGKAWGADYPDSENFLQLFYGKNIPPGPNDANYVNPEYDRLYESALAMRPSPERDAIYRKMRDILVEDCPSIWIAHRKGYRVIQGWLKNYRENAFEKLDARYLRVDTAAKK